MFKLKKFTVKATEIAGYLNRELIGDDFDISGPSNIRISVAGKTPRLDESAQPAGDILLISDRESLQGSFAGVILSQNPELDLAYVLREFFASAPPNEVHPSAVISSEARLGRNVLVGANVVIGPDVVIGDNTKIFHNSVINGPVSIGKFCVIKDGAVVGSEGWSFVRDEDGVPVHAPQLGQIVIGDRVWIGSNCSVERAMVDETRIAEDVKIDDLVHVGGGVRIGRNSQITAGVIVAYNVWMGENVVIGPNAVIREDVVIADGVVVGQGTVVLEDLAAGNVYVGNPAKLLKQVEKG